MLRKEACSTRVKPWHKKWMHRAPSVPSVKTADCLDVRIRATGRAGIFRLADNDIVLTLQKTQMTRKVQTVIASLTSSYAREGVISIAVAEAKSALGSLHVCSFRSKRSEKLAKRVEPWRKGENHGKRD